MIVRQYKTSKQQLTVTVEGLRNGAFVAYEGDRQILHAWSLDWLIDTLHMRYSGEECIREA